MTAQLAPDSFDAITALDVPASDGFLHNALTTLRPGGRLILIHTDGAATEEHVRVLERAGFTRILVEPILDGVLLRGEKPHTEARTVDRILQVAEREEAADFTAYKGRYVYLLVQQTPNKPIWALRDGERVAWRAVTVDDALLAFSSLPKAVAFMQPAVVAGLVKDINKVAKFTRETAQTWTQPVLLNAPVDVLHGRAVTLIDIDPATAEAPDE
jgi:hypothetical protein